jgi:hypothetical protein
MSNDINIKYVAKLDYFLVINNKSSKILFQFNSNKLNYFNNAYNVDNNFIYSKNVYEYSLFIHIFICLVLIQNYII